MRSDRLLAAWDCTRLGWPHTWEDAGGGLQICAECLAERWDPVLEQLVRGMPTPTPNTMEDE